MPYISTEEVKEIRNRIKKKFPKYKFSITREHGSGLTVRLMESDFVFEDNYMQINPYHYKKHFEKQPSFVAFLDGVMECIHTTAEPDNGGHWDSDYGFIPSFYINIHVGKWDKCHKTIAIEEVKHG